MSEKIGMQTHSTPLLTLIEKHHLEASLCFCADENRVHFQWLVDDTGLNYAESLEKAPILFLVADDLEPLGREQAQLIVLKIDAEAQKKHTFPALEARGFRVYDEISGYAFLFKIKTAVFDAPFLPSGDPNIISALSYGKWKDHPFIKESPARFLDLPAYDLLGAYRFDIAIKAHYARLSWQGMAKAWREHAYAEQALRITGPNKEIQEHDGTGKIGLDTFLKVFEGLIRADNHEKFPHVPLNKNLIPIDGAHRIAASIIQKNSIKAVHIDCPQNITSTASYYAGTEHGHDPCDPDVLDAGAVEYCRIRDTAAIALVFPCASNPDKAVEELGQIADIVYQKTIFMPPKAGRILLRQAYMGHEWVNFSAEDSGFDHKVRSCFPHSGYMQVVLIDNFKIKDLRPAKEKIRAFYKLGKHSIHITDSTQETLLIAKALFNDNSRSLMTQYSGQYLPAFHQKLSDFKNWMNHNAIDPEHICLVSSTVLSAYGLRECNDLDILYSPSLTLPNGLPKGVGTHHEIAKMYGHDIKDILGDPRLHFWYMGIKFCTPELVRTMKATRGERKDKLDLALLRKISHKKSIKLYGNLKVLLLYKVSKLYSIFYRALRKIKRLAMSAIQ